ncbi:MAG: hypothetical protein JSV04_12720 [Candidatus Heimdallarchaeota archaeon]|nr:MAG: hypothetical protein JSV04_12720 [Candidatus Heimdallarchaeota archaeon]
MSLFDDFDALLEQKPRQPSKKKTPPSQPKKRKKRRISKPAPINEEEFKQLKAENKALKTVIQNLNKEVSALKARLEALETEGAPHPGQDEIEKLQIDETSILSTIRHFVTTKNAASISALLFIAEHHPRSVSEDEILRQGFFSRKKYIRTVFRKRFVRTEGESIKSNGKYFGLLVISTQFSETHYRLSSYGEKFFQIYKDYFTEENVITRVKESIEKGILNPSAISLCQFIHNRFFTEGKVTIRDDIRDLSYYQITETIRKLIEIGLITKTINPPGVPSGLTCWIPRHSDISLDQLITS